MTINKLPRGYDPQGRPRDLSIHIGIVKDTSDVQRMGRIAVWIPEIGGDPEDREAWVICSYCSPFAGATSIRDNREDSTMDGSQKSYGFWMVPPDKDNEVAVFFANGDPARAFWFGCLYQQNMNHMIPGIAANRTLDPGAATGGGSSGSGGGGTRAPSGGGSGDMGGGSTGLSPEGFNTSYYATLAEAQQGLAQYQSAARFMRERPDLYPPEQQRAILRLEAAAAANVARLSAQQGTPVNTNPPAAEPARSGGGGAVSPAAGSVAGVNVGGILSGASGAASALPLAIPGLPNIAAGGGTTNQQIGSPTADTPKATTAMQFFTNRNFTQEQSAAIVGNLIRTSNLNTLALPDSPAQGIAGWSPERAQAFRARYGIALGDATFEQQLDFLHWDLTEGEQSSIGQQLLAASNVQEASNALQAMFGQFGGVQGAIDNATRVMQQIATEDTSAAARNDEAAPSAPPTAAQQAAAGASGNGIGGAAAAGGGAGGANTAMAAGAGTRIAPVTEYNKLNTGTVENPARPTFMPLAEGLLQQGLAPDPERGLSSSSARREAPSRVFGFLTPRGNTMHVDDNPENEFIRLRTRSGAQVLIHETTGYVYINSKGGNAWIEISDIGLDIYSTNSVSIRAEKDLNIRADKNILLDAGRTISLRAARGIFMESGRGITARSGQDIVVRSGGRLATESGGDTTMKSGGSHRIEASGDATTRAAGELIRQGSQIHDNSKGAPGIGEANAAVPQASSQSGVETTVTRMPTREPWPGHPRPGVPPTPGESGGENGPANPGTGGPTENGPNSHRFQTGEGPVDLTANDSPRCYSGARTMSVSTPVYNSIRDASQQTGVPFGYMMAMAHQESAFNPTARATTSSASGLYQFIDGTWTSMVSKHGARHNISINDRTDPRAQSLLAAEYARENARDLQRAGLPTGNTELYMAHFLGSGGARTMLRTHQTNPNAIAAEINPAAARANRSVFYTRDGRPRTVAEVRAWAEEKIEPRAQAYAQQAGLPAPCERPGASPAPSGMATASASPSRPGGGAAPA